MNILILAAAGLIMGAGSGSISGVIMSDQWGNPWVEVGALTDKDKALVIIYDCAGKPRTIGETPLSSLGSENSFKGFRPYLNATLQDLAAVSNQRKFQIDCMAASRAGQACGRNPERRDCKVVLEPSNNGGAVIPVDAWTAYDKMHPRERN